MTCPNIAINGITCKLSSLRESYTDLTSKDSFLRKVIVYMVNHRVQEFADPLTSTLVLMATSPLQMILCESGLLPFKTSLLPVIPYVYLSEEENFVIQNIISQAPDEFMHETMESSGQYTISIVPMTSNPVFVCKKQLLFNFVHVIFRNNKVYGDNSICKTLCNIILQRFMARVSLPSDMVSAIVQLVNSMSSESNNTDLLNQEIIIPRFTSDVDDNDHNISTENQRKRKRSSSKTLLSDDDDDDDEDDDDYNFDDDDEFMRVATDLQLK